MDYTWDARKTDCDLPDDRYHQHHTRSDFMLEFYVIGFCGGLWPCVMIGRKGGPFRMYYEHERALKHCHAEGILESRIVEWNWNTRIEDKFFNVATYQKLLPLFQQYKTPCFVLKLEENKNFPRHIIQINPVLKNFGFASIKSPTQAFQEIMQYISGVLGVGEPVTIEVDNAHKILAHGMDKTSFRKPKGTKRGKPQWR